MKLRDVTKLPLIYWCLVILRGSNTCATFTFMMYGPSFLVASTNYEPQAAGFIISAMNLEALFGPLIGLFLDRFGRKPIIWSISCLLMSISYLIIALELTNPLFWVLLIGMAYTVTNASVTSSISVVVPKEIIGTAYGIYVAYPAGILLFYPVIYGNVQELTGSYKASNDILAGTCFVTYLAGLLLVFVDRANGRLLSTPLNKQKIPQ
eukprot:TRINITY_DN2513_c0_g2_i2.p1 TRINITY_DN2513_c0_g2~~TRINITY_DN2513_c0_g2_i2.p1  ORF type:complete len:208 (-),score=19.51 TRINITY_DN2513_c0_g2_i2:135-758(-)